MLRDNGWWEYSIPVSTYVPDSHIHTGEAINLTSHFPEASEGNNDHSLFHCCIWWRDDT